MALKFTQKDRISPFGTRICEICGMEGITEYMYAMGASWHVTGHFMIPSFNCQTEETAQHWGCCPEHAMEALLACLNHEEHMSIHVMARKHAEANEKNHPRFAPEHQPFQKQRGDNFYIIGKARDGS